MEKKQDNLWIPKSFDHEISIQSFQPPEDPIYSKEIFCWKNWAISGEKNFENEIQRSWSFGQLPEIWSNMQFGSLWKDSSVVCFRALAETCITDEV